MLNLTVETLGFFIVNRLNACFEAVQSSLFQNVRRFGEPRSIPRTGVIRPRMIAISAARCVVMAVVIGVLSPLLVSAQESSFVGSWQRGLSSSPSSAGFTARRGGSRKSRVSKNGDDSGLEVRENFGDGTALVVTTLRRAQLNLDIPGAGKIEVDTNKPDDESAFANRLPRCFALSSMQSAPTP